MCLILLAIRPNDQFDLVVAANRDEFYARPTRMAEFWPDRPSLVCGKDLEMGGTWLGLTESGRFAAVTNYAEPQPNPIPPLTRGDLTINFLVGESPADRYLAGVQESSDQYRGFNLIAGEGSEFYYCSNRDGGVRTLSPGFYGLSNHLLDCDWPKVVEGRESLRRLAKEGFDEEALFSLLSEPGTDGQPQSARFIAGPDYGTRSSTVIRISKSGEASFTERNFLAGGEISEERRLQFSLSPAQP